MNASVNAPIKQAAGVKKWVWFTGTTALLEGQGVCYDYDMTGVGAALFDGRRSNQVELPSITNARYFAGVAAQAYAGRTGGRFIEVFVPGSCCNILAESNCVVGTGVLTCEAGGDKAGYFRWPGFSGQGTAVPLQTIDRSTAGKCQAWLQDGEPSGLVEVVSTNTDELLDGGATTIMVGGVTYFDVDIATGGAATATLADGTVPGLRKAFVCQATQTSDIDITVTSGVQGISNADPTTALAGFILDADLEEVTLQWDAFDTNGLWVVQHSVGATLANT